MTPAQAVTFLFGGAGYVYVTGKSGTFPATSAERWTYAYPDTGIPNVRINRTAIEQWGRMSIPANGGSYATFTVEITTAVASNCTAVNVGGVNQIAPVAMVAADNTASAAAIAAAINSFAAAAPDYSATSVGALVTGRCNVAGSTPNGGAVTLTFSVGGNAYVATPVSGGRTAGDNDIRIWIDTDPLATESTPTANWVDITDWLNGRALESPAVEVDATVVTGTLTIPRKAQSMSVRVSGPTALSTIDLQGAVEGDELLLLGVSGFPSDVLVSGNIDTANAATYPLTSPLTSIWLRYSTAGGGTFTEVSRSSRPTAADLRSLGIPEPLQSGVFQLTPSGGTMTITPGDTGASDFPGRVYEQDVSVTAAAAIGGALNFSVDTTSALPGDKGSISGNGFGITAFPVNFSDNTGVRATLTTEIAASGKWTVFWVVNKVSGANRVSFSLSPDFSTGNSGFVTTDMIKDAAVTDDKVASGIDGAKLSAGTVPETALDATAQAKLNSVSRFTVNSLNNVVAVNGGTYYMDATVGNLTATLPAIAANTYQILTFVKTDASVNTITGSGDANVNGAPDFTLASQYDAITIIGNGTEWFIASQMP